MNLSEKEVLVDKAIKNGKWLKIDYVDRKFKITNDRLIQPVQMRYAGSIPISVIANCMLRNDLRDFQFDGIQKIEVINPTEL